jgi:hypothetical protein
MPSKTCGDKRPQRASASKAKSSVLSQLSGLENVVFNDFIDDELDSEEATKQTLYFVIRGSRVVVRGAI